MHDAAPTIHLSDADFRKLTGLIARLSPRQQADLEGLEDDLARAEVVAPEQIPPDVVGLYSTVAYEDLESGRVTTVQLTYPEDAAIDQGRISVLAPVGAALLGLKVGQEIDRPLPDGRLGRLRVKQLWPHGELRDSAAGRSSTAS